MAAYHRKTTYMYSRDKTIQYDEDTEEPELLIVWASLAIKKEQILGNNHRQKLNTYYSDMIELPYKENLALFPKIPFGPFDWELTPAEFQKAKVLLEEDKKYIYNLIELVRESI